MKYAKTCYDFCLMMACAPVWVSCIVSCSLSIRDGEGLRKLMNIWDGSFRHLKMKFQVLNLTILMELKALEICMNLQAQTTPGNTLFQFVFTHKNYLAAFVVFSLCFQDFCFFVGSLG